MCKRTGVKLAAIGCAPAECACVRASVLAEWALEEAFRRRGLFGRGSGGGGGNCNAKLPCARALLSESSGNGEGFPGFLIFSTSLEKISSSLAIDQLNLVMFLCEYGTPNHDKSRFFLARPLVRRAPMHSTSQQKWHFQL